MITIVGKGYPQMGVINATVAHQKAETVGWDYPDSPCGIVCHRIGVKGDYDLSSESEVLNLLRRRKQSL